MTDKGEPRMLKAEELQKLREFLLEAVKTDLANRPFSIADRKRLVVAKIDDTLKSAKIGVDPDVKQQILGFILERLGSFGILQPLLDDADITEIMVNSMNGVYVEKKGRIEKTDVRFESDDQIMQVIFNIIHPLGRIIDTDHPTVDARLPDGSRVNAIIPPVAIDGPSITIRKFSKKRLSIQDLISFGTLTETMATFIEACVTVKLNIIVAGGTGSGKTTLLNVLSNFIPSHERIVTIEDAAEMQIQQEHVVRCESKAPNLDGKGGVTIRDLVRNALRMRPDRIVIGEVRGPEAMDMLQAMNTGHDGSLTTLHSNSSRDTVSRLETMCMMAEVGLPVKLVREQIASAVDLIIFQSRLTDGSRKITAVTEVSGIEGDMVTMTDIFKFEQTGITPEGKVIGEFKPTGIRPLFSKRLEAAGFKIGPEVYGASISDMLNPKKK